MANIEQDKRESFAQEIEIAAKLGFKGVSPLTLQEQGEFDLSNDMMFLIGILAENDLLPAVDQRIQELREEAEHSADIKTRPSVKPSEPTHQKQPHRPQHPASSQDNFFPLVDAATSSRTSDETPEWRDPERKLARLHNAFQRIDGHERNRILAPDAGRDTREFFKKIGVPTWSEKRKIFAERYRVYVTFLQDIGLWDTISRYGVTDDIKSQLQEVLGHLKSYAFDYDPAQQRTIARFLRAALQEHSK